MEEKKLEFLLTVGALVLKYGIPAAVSVIDAWKNQDPTLEDIAGLRAIKPPEEYLKQGGV